MPKHKLRYRKVGFAKSDDVHFRQSESAFLAAGIVVTEADSDSDDVDVIVHKTSPARMRQLYPEVADSGLSVTDRGVRPYEIHLSQANWTKIPTHLGSEYTNLSDYRSALVSHEFAHALGHDHVHCACVGCVADVRQQPSRGLRGCKPTARGHVAFHANAPHTQDNF